MTDLLKTKVPQDRMIKNTDGTEAIVEGLGFCIVLPDGYPFPIPPNMTLNDARIKCGYKAWAVGEYGENLWKLVDDEPDFLANSKACSTEHEECESCQ